MELEMSDNTTNSSNVRNTAQYLLDIEKAGAAAFDAGALRPEYSRMVVDAASLAKKEELPMNCIKNDPETSARRVVY